MDRGAREKLDDAMARLAKGDRGAFSFVFQALWPALSRACTRWLDDSAEGEDAAQKAIIEMMGRAHEYDPEESALAWALTIAMWECRSVRRRRFRARLEPLAAIAERASSAPSPESLAGERELTQGMLRLVGELSETDRRLLEETVLQESENDGPVPASVRKRKQRALDRLRELFRRLYGA